MIVYLPCFGSVVGVAVGVAVGVVVGLAYRFDEAFGCCGGSPLQDRIHGKDRFEVGAPYVSGWTKPVMFGLALGLSCHCSCQLPNPSNFSVTRPLLLVANPHPSARPVFCDRACS